MQKLQTAFYLAAEQVWPALAVALYRLNRVLTPAVPTMAVDRYWRLYLNPRFVDETPMFTLALLITNHELLHLLYGHTDGPRHDAPDLVNLAQDLAINTSLNRAVEAANQDIGGGRIVDPSARFSVPEGIAYPKLYTDPATGKPFPDDLTSMEYLDLLRKQVNVTGGNRSGKKSGGGGKSQPQQGPPDPNAPCSGKCGSGAGGTPGEWELGPPDPDPSSPNHGVTDAEMEVLKDEVARSIARQEAEKSRGLYPAGLVSWAKLRLKPPQNDWRRLVRPAVSEAMVFATGYDERTYARPNRRTYDAGVLIPTWRARVPEILFVFDTSGSMNPQDYDNGFSEMMGAARQRGMRKVPCLMCDAKAYDVVWASSTGDLPLIGGGGTDMTAGLVAAVGPAVRAQVGYRPKAVLVLTDGYTPWPNEPVAEGLQAWAVITSEAGFKCDVPAWINKVRAFNPADAGNT
jgi:predicted metal-dependent peptidase